MQQNSGRLTVGMVFQAVLDCGRQTTITVVGLWNWRSVRRKLVAETRAPQSRTIPEKLPPLHWIRLVSGLEHRALCRDRGSGYNDPADAPDNLTAHLGPAGTYDMSGWGDEPRTRCPMRILPLSAVLILSSRWAILSAGHRGCGRISGSRNS